MHLHLVLGYSGYFVLGYYLSKIEIPKKLRKCIYIISLLGFIATIIGTAFISIYNNEPTGILYNDLSINVLCQAIGVFIFVKYLKQDFNQKTQKIILTLSKYSFGVYLIHPLIISILKFIGLNTMSFNPICSVLIIAIIVSILSLWASIILNHIPILKKYIV